MIAELETCQNNMTHFYYELVRPVRSQIASEVVARGRNWNKVIQAKKFAQKRADIRGSD